MDTNELAMILRLNWNKWHDVDRGEAIVALRKARISLRGVARFVGCSEALIRHLEIVGNAPPLAKEGLRNGRFSTRRLVKVSRELRKQRSAVSRA